MADEPDTEVTIRYPHTGEEKQVPRGAVPFFPGWDVLKKDGSVNPRPATTTTEKG